MHLQGFNAGYAHRRRALQVSSSGASSPAASAFVNVCEGAVGGGASTSVALVDTTDGATLLSPAYVALQPGVSYVLSFAAGGDFALAGLTLPLAGAGQPSDVAVSLSLASAGGANEGAPVWWGSTTVALGATPAFVALPFGAGAAGAAGLAYKLTLRVDRPAQWAYGLPLTVGAGSLPGLTVAVDGGAATAAAFLPGLRLLATLTGGATCTPALAPAGPVASAADAALFTAAGVAAAAAPAGDCVTDNALAFLDSVEGGRFVAQAGFTLQAGTAYALTMPWACTSCIAHLSELVLPLAAAAACPAGPITITANVGKWIAGAFVQSVAEAAAPLIATVALTDLPTAFAFVPPNTWTLTAPAAADADASQLAITISVSACASWAVGVAGAAQPGVALYTAANGQLYEPSAELGGATVLAWVTPAATCPAQPAPVPAPAPGTASPSAAPPAPAASRSASATPSAQGGDSSGANTASTGSGDAASSGLSGGAVAGIVIGCVVGAAVLVAAGIAVKARASRRNAAAAASSA